MDCWSMDIMGPISHIFSGAKKIVMGIDYDIYILRIVDEFSRYIISILLRKKSEATFQIINQIRLHQNRLNIKLKRARFDGGGEFDNTEFRSWLSMNGTEYRIAPPYTPQFNGIVEQMNLQITNISNTIRMKCGATHHLFSYADLYATFLWNYTTHPTINDEIPAVRFGYRTSEGKTLIDKSKFRVWGCDAFVLKTPPKRAKADKKTIIGTYMGYDKVYDEHNILIKNEDSNEIKIIVSRNVYFIEDSFDHIKIFNKIIEKQISAHEKAQEAENEDVDEFDVEIITAKRINHEGQAEYLVKWKNYPVSKSTWEPLINLTNCKTKLLEFEKSELDREEFYRIEELQSSTPELTRYVLPTTYKGVLKHQDRIEWLKAIDKELESCKNKGVYRIVDKLPPGHRALSTRWVLTVKKDSENRIIRHKARLVVRGFEQIHGVDYNETYAPTAKWKLTKILLYLAVAFNYEIKQLDFETAFLNAPLEEDIYIQIPDGFMEAKPPQVLKLEKALYGLKQAPREWNKALHKYLLELQYRHSPIDPCVYVKRFPTGLIILSIYVDDTIIFYPKTLEKDWLKDKILIGRKYPIKDLGDCEWILNMSITRDRINNCLTISQEAYIQSILNEHNITTSKHLNHPYVYDDLTVPPTTGNSYAMDTAEHKLYRSMVGEVLYAAISTRGDIAYLVYKLSTFLADPYNYHLTAVRQIYKYLHQTIDKKMIIVPTKHVDFESSSNNGDDLITYDHKILTDFSQVDIDIYADSNWAGDKKDAKSTSGQVVLINNNVIHWQSKKQSCTGLSSTEAEFYSLHDAVREGVYLSQWFEHIIGVKPIITIYCDNQSAIQMIDHATNHNRTKHMNIRYFFIRETMKDYHIRIKYVESARNIADILTKRVTNPVFERLSKFYCS